MHLTSNKSVYLGSKINAPVERKKTKMLDTDKRGMDIQLSKMVCLTRLGKKEMLKEYDALEALRTTRNI